MIDATLIFVLLLSALLDRIKATRWFWPVVGFIIFLVMYNLIYFLEYNLNIIHRFKPVFPKDVIGGIPRIIPLLTKYL